MTRPTSMHGVGKNLIARRGFLAGAAMGGSLLAPAWAAQRGESAPVAPGRWQPVDPPNRPMGDAKGIFPGRVVWMHNPDAARWDGDPKSGGWFEDKFTEAALADAMLSQSLRLLSGAKTDADAWAALFRHYNRSHGRGDQGYRPGEKVAVKLNLNCSTSREASPEAGFYNTPQLTHALFRQLVHQAHVREDDIVAYDASRWVSDTIYLRCHPEFPAIRFEDNAGTEGRFQIQPDRSAAVHFGDQSLQDNAKTYLPACATKATYLINACVMKGHSLAGITLCAKNHFGSVWRENTGGKDRYHGWTPSNMHSAITVAGRSMGTYNALVDLMGHEHLGGKTVLYLIDGLYAAPHQSVGPERWQSPPFNGHWTASLFISQDPVAIESVAADFFAVEPSQKLVVGAMDNYLHEAALAGQPPSGTRYDPEGDGTGLASLGVHEHWNSPEKKEYTRNLGTGQGIELVKG